MTVNEIVEKALSNPASFLKLFYVATYYPDTIRLQGEDSGEVREILPQDILSTLSRFEDKRYLTTTVKSTVVIGGDRNYCWSLEITLT